MLLAWMLGTALFSGLLCVAAAAVDSAMRLLTCQGRRVWIVALAISVVWPVCAAFLPRLSIARLSPVIIDGATSGGAPAVFERVPAFVNAAAPHLDTGLALVWIALSLTLAVRLFRAHRALERIRRSAERTTINGVDVLVTPVFGPATIGLRHPVITMPVWISELDAPLLALIVRHEREH
jgi:beta-lactamase regulating signal transducer with metallopeptidase domain